MSDTWHDQTDTMADALAASLPFVTVVVPSHGRCMLLGRLLQSLVRQTYPVCRYEIIVVDNAVGDGTAEMVRTTAAGALVPISYHAKEFTSPAPSRQFGAEIGHGTVIAFIDDDCVAADHWLAAGVAALRPGVGLVQGRTLPNPEQRRPLLEKTVTIDGASPFFETCNIFYDRTAFWQVGGFSPEFVAQFYGEDTDLGWKVKIAGFETSFAEDALVYHEVFRVSFLKWLIEPARFCIWPYLASKFPDIRSHFYYRIFLNRTTASFNLFMVGLFLGILGHVALLLLCLPYLLIRYMDGGRFAHPLLRIARIIFGLLRAAVAMGALTYGSVRARTLVL
jgi:GT2 family glycosyltransferase